MALGNATIYSITRATALNGTDNTKIPILITVLTPQGGSPDLTQQLMLHLEATAREIDITVESVERFGMYASVIIRYLHTYRMHDVDLLDGCEESQTILPPLEPNGLSVVLEWSETDIGTNLTLGCPCGNLSAVTGNAVNRTAYRVCRGSFSTGAFWDTAMVSGCNFTSTTRRLCQVANVS